MLNIKTLSIACLSLLLCAACDQVDRGEDANLNLNPAVPAPKTVANNLAFSGPGAQTDSWASDLELVAAFNSQYGEAPESVVVDFEGNLVVSLSLTGELRKIDPQGTQSTLAWIPLGQCAPNPFPPILGALAVDAFSNVYVGAAACDPSNRGIWRVSPEGDASLIATLPVNALPNGIAVRAGRVYVADTGSTKIWRAPTFGDGSPAEVWTEEPLLADPDPYDAVPGANGLQFYLGAIYVANAGAGTIVEIPFEPGGPLGGDLQPLAGQVKYGPEGSGAEHVTPASFPGCDDFAFDLLGRIYCTTDPFETVELIHHDGSVDVIWDAEDGLDGPTSAMFGRGTDSTTLYISNAAFPFFPTTGNGPSVLKAQVGIPGYPFR
jgi:sugar lactone lactonase YvrE